MSTRIRKQTKIEISDWSNLTVHVKETGRVPEGGWLRAVRIASGSPQAGLAEKLGCKRQAWAQLEASEAREAITLASLRRAADALGADLVYFLRPRPIASGVEDTPGEAEPQTKGPRTKGPRDLKQNLTRALRLRAFRGTGEEASGERQSGDGALNQRTVPIARAEGSPEGESRPATISPTWSGGDLPTELL
jgi:transcriptional regulator with XRE-family HTH domain